MAIDAGSFPAALFSPSKMVYIAYIVLLGLKVLPVGSVWVFVGGSVIFWIAEIVHNDYLRIKLNRKAEK
jgi:hypothetical protein